jgi:hypothetical protein
MIHVQDRSDQVPAANQTLPVAWCDHFMHRNAGIASRGGHTGLRSRPNWNMDGTHQIVKRHKHSKLDAKTNAMLVEGALKAQQNKRMFD